MSEFTDFLGLKSKGSTDEKISSIMETLEVLSSIIGDRLPSIINQQIQELQKQIDALNYKMNSMGQVGGTSPPPGMTGGAPAPPGMSPGAPPPPGMAIPGGAPPGLTGPPPPPGAPPPPGGRRPAGPASLKASIMDELKSLLAKRRTETG
ncbi:MAG: hypothetical protein ACTSUE_03550 [Promethearchaeota archaeon]